MKILLIDDDAFLRDMYATKFREAGHTVEIAESGQEALDALKNSHPDVVLLDMVMPGMDGTAFLVSAVEQAAPSTKFIVLSNQSEETDKQKVKDIGAAGYIVKAESIPSEVVTKVEALA